MAERFISESLRHSLFVARTFVARHVGKRRFSLTRQVSVGNGSVPVVTQIEERARVGLAIEDVPVVLRGTKDGYVCLAIAVEVSRDRKVASAAP
jgi:hypothetical protein